MYPLEAQHIVFATVSDSCEEWTYPRSKPKPAEKCWFFFPSAFQAFKEEEELAEISGQLW